MDGKHVVFGEVLEGKDIIKSLEKLGSKSDTPSQTVTITDSGVIKSKF